MDLLETTIFGTGGAYVQPPPSSGASSNNDCDLHTRTARAACQIPLLPGHDFETLLVQLSELGFGSTSAMCREIANPLTSASKKTLIALNEDVLCRLAQHGAKVKMLSSTVGGKTWVLGQDETLQLSEAEARATDLINTSSAISARIDTVLEVYDRAVRVVSERLIEYNNAKAPSHP